MAEYLERATREWWAQAVGRRSLLRGSLIGGIGLATAALIGCGGDDDDDDDSASTQTTTSGTTTTATTSGTTSGFHGHDFGVLELR